MLPTNNNMQQQHLLPFLIKGVSVSNSVKLCLKIVYFTPDLKTRLSASEHEVEHLKINNSGIFLHNKVTRIFEIL